MYRRGDIVARERESDVGGEVNECMHSCSHVPHLHALLLHLPRAFLSLPSPHTVLFVVCDIVMCMERAKRGRELGIERGHIGV